MALTNFDEDQFDQEPLGGEEIPPLEPEKKPSNKNFLIAIGIVGVIFILALILLLLLGPGLLARQRAAQQEQAAQINAANTATAMAATALVQAQQATMVVKTTVAPTATRPAATRTPVVVVQQVTQQPTSEATAAGLSPEELATVAALQTQMAVTGGGGGTPAPTATALPTSGFADEVGLPMMAGLAVVLVAVILLSRKLRMSTR
jgi:hypothetical protein